MENDEILHRWINRTITPEELETFRKRPEYESLARLYGATKNLRSPDFDSETMLKEILKQSKLPGKLDTSSRRRFLGTWVSYAAAALVLLLAAWWLWPANNIQRYKLTRGEQLNAELPDGSSFTLNAESELTYNKENWPVERRLNLDGEAFFEVTKGSAFRVITPLGEVQVLGTSFNVFARDDFFEVVCYTGKVSVNSLGVSNSVVLDAGQAVQIVNNRIAERWDITSDQPEWMSGVSSFRNVSLRVVLSEIERQFDINIDYSEVNVNSIITSNFPHEDLERALRIVLTPVDIQYQIVDDKNVRLLPE